MAKPFYSIEEVCAKLGKTADEVKGLVRAGTLREFRDAGKVFFKAEDVDSFGKSKSDTGEILLEPADEGGVSEGLPSLVSSSGGTSIIGLEPLPEEEKPAKKEDTVITASGIGVFDEEELEIDADPMAKTQITPTTTGDQVSLEGTGSGSGLLDLTREADDTSLGAELLDEIYPGEEETAAKAPPRKPAIEEEEAAEEPEPVPIESGEALTPVIVSTYDPAEGALSGLLVGAVILMAVSGAVVAGMLQQFVPDFAQFLSNQFLWFSLGAVLVAAISLLVGLFVGKAMAPRRR
jgi:hypothetical protein